MSSAAKQHEGGASKTRSTPAPSPPRIEPEPGESHSRFRMRKLVETWLAQKPHDVDQLARWLEGLDFPAVGHDEEPYIWLLRGIPLGSRQHEATVALARAAAELLQREPDVKRPGHWPARLLYNLLYFCAGLESPDELADPLYALFERNKLQGEWLGLHLGVPLCAALIFNQRDNRLEPQWEQMAEENGHPILGGNRFSAFEAVLHMPPSARERARPATEAVFFALSQIIRHIESRPNKVEILKQQLERILERFPTGRDEWDYWFLRGALQEKWPDWALWCLPSLCVRVDRIFGADILENGYVAECLLWHGYLAPFARFFLEHNMRYRILHRYRGGRLLLVQMDQDVWNVVELLPLGPGGQDPAALFGVPGVELMRKKSRGTPSPREQINLLVTQCAGLSQRPDLLQTRHRAQDACAAGHQVALNALRNHPHADIQNSLVLLLD